MEKEKRQENLVEKLGIILEKDKMPPVAARVAALLLITDKCELTFDEIREILKVSKSAASNAINFLLRTNDITYGTKPGDRKRYFKSNVQKWRTNLMDRLEDMSIMSDVLDEVLQERTGETPEFNASLENVIAFMRYLHSEIGNIYDKWDAINSKNKDAVAS